MTFTESHPSIRFRQVPVVPGPLSRLEQTRATLLDEVVKKTKNDLPEGSLESLLGDALYTEKLRLKRESSNIFTSSRFKRDRKLWSRVREGLLLSSGEVNRKELLDDVLRHYAEEVGGHFNPRVYQFATHAVPWGFSWLFSKLISHSFLEIRLLSP